MFKIKFNISWTYLIFKTRILSAVIVLQLLFNIASCQNLQAASSSPVLLTISNPNLSHSGVYVKNRSHNPTVDLEPRNAESHPHPNRLKTEAIIHPVNVPVKHINNGGQREPSVSAVVSHPTISNPNGNSRDQDVKIVSSIELKAESSVFPTIGVIGFKYPESDVNWRPEKSLLDMTEAFIKDDVQEYLYRKHKEKLDSEVVTIEKSKEITPSQDLSNFIPQSTREPDYDREADRTNYGSIWGPTESNYPQLVAVSPQQSTSSRPIDPRYAGIWETTTTTKKPIDPQYAGIWETTTSTRTPIDPQYAGLWETTTSTKRPIDPQFSGLWETKDVSKSQKQNLDLINDNSKHKNTYDSYKHKPLSGKLADDLNRQNIKYTKHGSSNSKSKKHHHVGKYGHTDVEPYSSNRGDVALLNQGSVKRKNEKPYSKLPEAYSEAEESSVEAYSEHAPTHDTPRENHDSYLGHGEHEPTYHTPTDSNNKQLTYTEHKPSYQPSTHYNNKPYDYREHKSSYDTPTVNHNKPYVSRDHESSYHTQTENRSKPAGYTQHEPNYHAPKEDHNKPYDDREYESSNDTPTENHNKPYDDREHKSSHDTPTENHNKPYDDKEHESSYNTPTENHKPDGYIEHEPNYHAPRENHNEYHDYPTNHAPTEYHSKHQGYEEHAPTYQTTTEHSDYAEQEPTYHPTTINYKEDYDEIHDNGGKTVDNSGLRGIKQYEDHTHTENSGGSWEASTPEKIQNEFLQQVQSIKEGNGNTWQATGPGSAFHNFYNPIGSNEQIFANSPVPVIPLSPVPHTVGQNAYYWPPSHVTFFGHKDPGVQYHWQPIYHMPTESYRASTSPQHEINTNYNEDHNRDSANSERYNEEKLKENTDTKSNDEETITDEKPEATSNTRHEEVQEERENREEKSESDGNQEAEEVGETQEENDQEGHDGENEKQQEESSGTSDNHDPYYDENFGTDAAFKPPPPDHDEERVRGFVSDHEFPRDNIPTRLGYQGGGLWAKPHSDSGIQLGFVPTQIYTQVRRQSTVKHLPREEAYAAASTPEEIINAPRLREVVSHKKIQEVYEEEGYEDLGYDHGGYNKHGQHAQGHEKNLGDDSEDYDETVSVPSQAEAEREHLQHVKNVDSVDDTQGAAQRQVVQRIEDKPKVEGTWKQQKVVTNEKSMMFTDDIGRGGILTEKLPPKMEGTVGQYVNLNGKRVPIVKKLNDVPGGLSKHGGETLFQRVSHPPLAVFDQSASIEASLFGFSGENFRSAENQRKQNKLERIPLLSTDHVPPLNTDSSEGSSSVEPELTDSRDEASAKISHTSGTYNHYVTPKLVKLQKASDSHRIPVLHSGFGKETPTLQKTKYTEDKHVRESIGLVDSANGESIKHYTKTQEVRTPFLKTPSLVDIKHSVFKETENSNVQGEIPANHKHETSVKQGLKNGDVSGERDDHLLYIIYKGQSKQNEKIKGIVPELAIDSKNYKAEATKLTDTNGEDTLFSLSSTDDNQRPKTKHKKNKIHVVRRSNRKYKLIPRLNVTRSDDDEESKSETSREEAPNWKVSRNENKLNTRHPFLPIDGGNEKIVLPLPPPRRTTPDPEELETYTRAPHRASLREHTTRRHQQTTTTSEPIIPITSKPVHMENVPNGLLSKIRTNVYLAAVYNQTIQDLKEAFQQKSEDTSAPVKQVEELTAAHYSEPRNEKKHRPVTSSQQERISNLARQLNSPSDIPETVTTKFNDNISRERVRRSTDFISLDAPKTVSKTAIDDNKYPFYKRPPRGHLAKYSPLRYATNPKNIPRKTSGGMEFYESRDRIVYCEEPTPPKDIVPKRGKDGEWNKNPTPKVPRLTGLGDKILCMKIKYFDEDPLDNPFFKEEDVNIPEVFSSGVSVKLEDQLGLYEDILSHIKNNMNENQHGNALLNTDQSLHQSVPSPSVSVGKQNKKAFHNKNPKAQLKESDKNEVGGKVAVKQQSIPSDDHSNHVHNTGSIKSLNLVTTPKSVESSTVNVRPVDNESLKSWKHGQSVTTPIKYDIMKIITPASKYNFPDTSTHRPIVERRPGISNMKVPTFFTYKSPIPLNHLVPPLPLQESLYQKLNRPPTQRQVIYLHTLPINLPLKIPRSIFDYPNYKNYNYRPYSHFTPYMMPQARVIDLQTAPASVTEITADAINMKPKRNVGTIEYIISIEPKVAENLQNGSKKLNTHIKRDTNVGVLNNKWWFPATYDNRRGEPKYFTYRTKRDVVNDKNDEYMKGKDSIELLNSLLKNHKIPKPDVGRSEDGRNSADRKHVNNTLHSEEDMSRGRKLINRILGGFVSRHNPAYSSKYSKIDPLLQQEDTAGGNSNKTSRRDVSNNTTNLSLNRPKVRFPKLAVGTRLIAKQEVVRPPKQQVPETTPARIITTTTTTTTTERPITTTRMYKPRRVVKKDFHKGKIVDVFAVLNSQRESGTTDSTTTERVTTYSQDEESATDLVQLARPESTTAAIKPRRLQQVEHRRVTKEETFKKTYIPHYDREETRTTTHRVDTFDVLRDHPDLRGPISRSTRDYEEDDLAPMGDEILYNETLMYIVNPKTGEGYWESVPYDGTRKPERLDSDKSEEKSDKAKKPRRNNGRKRNRNLQQEEVTEYSNDGNDKKIANTDDVNTFRKRKDEAQTTVLTDVPETEFTEAPAATDGTPYKRRKNRTRHTPRRLKNKVYVMGNLLQQVPPSESAVDIHVDDASPRRIGKPETKLGPKIIVEPDKRKYFYVVDK